MKHAIYVLLTFLFISCNNRSSGDEAIPVLLTDSDKITLRLNNQYMDNDIPFDMLTDTITNELTIYGNNILTGIYTDRDSVLKDLSIGSSFTVHIKKENSYPFIFTIHNGLDIKTLGFDTQSRNDKIRYIYDEDTNSPYLNKLRSLYPVDSLAAAGKTDIEKVRNIASYVHNLWDHDGMNEPEQNDALYILEEVKKGRRFRCVEYGIVTTAFLNTIGLKSRVLSLRTEDVETRESGAGHVVMEVFLNDLNKWVMVDSQFDMITHVNNIPLNAVELQQAIVENKNIGFWTTEEKSIPIYLPWLYPYLYYFAVPFDNRENVKPEDRLLINGKRDIMLVPAGAKEPTVFQKHYPINNCIYSNSLQDFYRKP